jgi:hypothetical protein
LIPPRASPVVSPDVESVIDNDRPNPCRGAIGLSIFTKRCDVQIICLSDLG